MSPVASVVLIFGRIRYRAWQFLRGLRPALSVDEITEARQRLSASEFDLFLAAQPRDRRHSVDLMQLLQREGIVGKEPSAELLVAALLHDVGKGAVTTSDRVAFVVLNACSERLARWCEREHGVRWRRALWRLRHHAELGAGIVETAGTSHRAVEIVRRHTEPFPAADVPRDTELKVFVAADGRV